MKNSHSHTHKKGKVKVCYVNPALTSEWLGTSNIGKVWSGNMTHSQCKAFYSKGPQ